MSTGLINILFLDVATGKELAFAYWPDTPRMGDSIDLTDLRSVSQAQSGGEPERIVVGGAWATRGQVSEPHVSIYLEERIV